MLGKTNVVIGVEKIGIVNQNKTIKQNGTYKADEGYTGLGEVIVDVSNSSTGGTNTFSLATVLEKMNEILYSKISKTNNIAENILQTEMPTEEEDTSVWKYDPKNITEYYQNILTCDNLYVQNRLNATLGEI